MPPVPWHRCQLTETSNRFDKEKPRMATKPGTSRILLAAAVIAFVLAAFGVAIGDVNLIAIGLALGFGSFLV